MNIWLISIFEQTPIDENIDTRFNSLFRIGVKNGHNMVYFSSTFKHGTKNQRYERTTSVRKNSSEEIVFVKSLKYSKNVSIKRLFSHLLFSKSILKELEKRKKPDVVVTAFPPISLSFEISKWCISHNIPLIIDVIDPWPDSFRVFLHRMPKICQDFILFPFMKKTREIFRDAKGVTSISNKYVEWSRKYNPAQNNCRVFYPAVNFDEIQNSLKNFLKQRERDHSELRVIYAGSLASSYDIKCILKAAEYLENVYGDIIKFIIAGSGPQEDEIKKYLERHTNLAYLGRISKKDLLKEYCMADIGLTQHIMGATQSITYKLFDLLSCGLPIINSLESEMKNFILDNRVGDFNQPGDYISLARCIESYHLDKQKLLQFRNNARKLASEIGDSKIVYKDMLEFVISTI